MKTNDGNSWIEGNYRRIFLDMHIDDWNEEFLSKLDPEAIIKAVKETSAQTLVVKGKPHTGLCYWPSTLGRMHRGLKDRDYVGEMIDLCHENDIDAIVYFSQIFDNWAYDNRPSWRCVFADGLTSRERPHPLFQQGRYGVVCPNNPEYRNYIKTNLTELVERYEFEGMFLDMPFWPDVCFCSSCRERYRVEFNGEIPLIVDWRNSIWREFQFARERWMGEFAAFSSRCIKEGNPKVTVEHNFATALFPWQFANTELVMDACDYAGGDYYGGYLQQTYACKYYRNISPNLPFAYITSRCDPDLLHHTTTKSRKEMLQHSITALVHNGAFSICDGMNPDGTICGEAYADVIGDVFATTRPFEGSIGGDLLSNVSIWVATHSKYNMHDNNKGIDKQIFDPEAIAASKIRMASILREYHIPFNVVPNRSIPGLCDDVLVVSDIISIRDDEMDDIEGYVRNGGNLYLSGNIGCERLYKLLELRYLGMTEHDFTYMSPTKEGEPFFEGFTRQYPLTVAGKQHIVEISGSCEVLATITLPYTPTDGAQFASIHSNPPGINTEMPAVIVKPIGKGFVMWLSAPIETSKPYMSRKVVRNLLVSLCGELEFSSNAPAFVEVIGWAKDGRRYYAAIDQLESSVPSPVYQTYIDIPEEAIGARLVGTGASIEVERVGGRTRIALPTIDTFAIVEVELIR
jgi:hypothetical protein